MIIQILERATFLNLSLFLMLLFTSLMLYNLSGYFNKALLAMRMPGLKAYPIIGNSHFAIEGNVLDKRAVPGLTMYGGLTRLWFFVYPVFVVSNPDYLQVILQSSKHTDKSFFYQLLHNFLGNGLITSSGLKWSTHRKYIQPTFHLNILEKFVETFVDSAQCLHDKLKHASEVLNITHFVNDCVLDILNEAILGVPINSSSNESKETSPFRKGKVVAQDRIAHPWLLFNWIYKFTENASEEYRQKKRLTDFTRQMIRKRRDVIEKDGKIEGRKSMLDYMIEISNKHPDFTEDDIIDEACTFMLAGQDSVGASLAYAIWLFAQNPSHQQKCVEEIDAIFGSDDRSPTMNDLRDMKYLEMCIKEALRLYPAVPVLTRRLGEAVKCGKYILPAGSDVMIISYVTHRDESVYPEAEKFIPERFSQENIDKRNPYAFLPFSAGPRNCIGHKFALIEMKTVISKILRGYKILPVPGKTTFEPIFRITLRAKGGLWVKLEPRNNNE